MRSAWEETSLSAPGGAGTSRRVGAGGRGIPDRADPAPDVPPLQRRGSRSASFDDRDPSRIASVESSESRLSPDHRRQAPRWMRNTSSSRSGSCLSPMSLRGWRNSSATRSRSRPASRTPAATPASACSSSAAARPASRPPGWRRRPAPRSSSPPGPRVRWFADHEPHYPRGRVQARLYRLAYPVVGYGPPPLNRLVMMPDVFADAAGTNAALADGAHPALGRLALAPGVRRAQRPGHRAQHRRARRAAVRRPRWCVSPTGPSGRSTTF